MPLVRLRVTRREARGLHLSTSGVDVLGPFPDTTLRLGTRLADHLVCLHEDGRGERKAESLRGGEVHDEFQLPRLLHRQVGGLRAFQDLIHVRRGATKQIIGPRKPFSPSHADLPKP